MGGKHYSIGTTITSKKYVLWHLIYVRDVAQRRFLVLPMKFSSVLRYHRKQRYCHIGGIISHGYLKRNNVTKMDKGIHNRRSRLEAVDEEVHSNQAFQDLKAAYSLANGFGPQSFIINYLSKFLLNTRMHDITLTIQWAHVTAEQL